MTSSKQWKCGLVMDLGSCGLSVNLDSTLFLSWPWLDLTLFWFWSWLGLEWSGVRFPKAYLANYGRKFHWALLVTLTCDYSWLWEMQPWSQLQLNYKSEGFSILLEALYFKLQHQPLVYLWHLNGTHQSCWLKEMLIQKHRVLLYKLPSEACGLQEFVL